MRDAETQLAAIGYKKLLHKELEKKSDTNLKKMKRKFREQFDTKNHIYLDNM